MIFDPSPAQKLALEHLLTHDQAALFMGCGLGKTAVALHMASYKMLDGESNGALVVAPLRVCNLTWPAEADKWDTTRSAGVFNLRTQRGRDAFARGARGIYVTNYEMLQRHAADWGQARRLPFDTVIFDELTKAKSHKSVNINSIRPIIRKHCKRRWGLTGTPAPNGLQDLFAQIRLLDDGVLLGRGYTDFRNCWFKQDDYMGYSWSPKPGAEERIYEKLKGIALTLKSSDWLHIPDVVQEDIEASLPAGDVARGYRTLERDLLLPIQDSEAEITAVNAAVLVNKLLQYTSGAIYDETHKWHLIHDTKIEALRRLVKSLKGEPLIVFYQFKHELERLRAHAAELGLTAFSDAGTIREQEELITKWNSGGIKVLAAHPKSMAHGLNLQQGGSSVAWLSLTWSREDYDQAIARVARRGQTEVTRVYRFVTRDTVDEAVLEALRSKGNTQDALLNALRRYAGS